MKSGLPAVTKMRSEFCTSCSIAERLSIAAILPTSGFPPAPRPLEISFPILSLFSIGLFDKA